MQILRDIASLRRSISGLRSARPDIRIAMVPTMGALHEGHLSLVRAAKTRADHVVVSIFVNPTQFGPNEDLDAYPRDEARDSRTLAAEGVAVVWMPAVDTMYPEGFATRVTVKDVSEGLCGAVRPGHFDGVATVVAKLLNQVRPDVALFGEKDFQQLAVIRRMVADLDMETDIVGVPTARDADGLALSSRNAYLSEDERRRAAEFPRALREAVAAIEAGGDPDMVLEQVRIRLTGAGFARVDYVELRDSVTLEPVRRVTAPARLLAAVRIGTTRLIDNFPVLSDI